MKPSVIVSSLLLNLSLFSACGGSSNIGSSKSDGGSANLGGAKTTVDAKAGEAGSNTLEPSGGGGIGGVPSRGGAGGAGGTALQPLPSAGAGSSDEPCQVDLDCLGLSDACRPCSGGGFDCKRSCVGGKCVTRAGSCPAACSTDDECPLGCIVCGGGQELCAKNTCLMGVCQTAKPACATQSCAELACGDTCMVCDVAAASCYTGYCGSDGQCQGTVPHCGCATAMDCTPPPFCLSCSDSSCATFDCVSSKCSLACPSGSEVRCQSSEDCALLERECMLCPSGQCAVQACIQSSCTPVCPLN